MMTGEEARQNGWKEWSKYVLKELERLNACYESLDKKLDTAIQDLVMLKVKAGVWGLLAGMIPVGIMLLMQMVSR